MGQQDNPSSAAPSVQEEGAPAVEITAADAASHVTASETNETPSVGETPSAGESATASAAPETSAAAALQGLSKMWNRRPQVTRFAALAASIAIAAAVGSIAGALAGGALTRSANETQVSASALQTTLQQVRNDLAALKTAVDGNNKSANTQLAKLGERIDKAQSEPAAKLARIAEAVDRLEKKPQPSSDITGSIGEKRPAVVEGWILRDIFNGRALLESRAGLFEVGPGSNLPGVGRVESIKRQDGRWVVTTPKGVIVSAR